MNKYIFEHSTTTTLMETSCHSCALDIKPYPFSQISQHEQQGAACVMCPGGRYWDHAPMGGTLATLHQWSHSHR